MTHKQRRLYGERSLGRKPLIDETRRKRKQGFVLGMLEPLKDHTSGLIAKREFRPLNISNQACFATRPKWSAHQV